jgi:hypothetical protein
VTSTAIVTCEQIIDQAGELGVRLQRAAADRRGLLPAECAIHLRDALGAVRRAADALERSINAMPREATSRR